MAENTYVTMEQFNAFAEGVNASLKMILERLDAPQASPQESKQEKKGIDYKTFGKTTLLKI